MAPADDENFRQLWLAWQQDTLSGSNPALKSAFIDLVTRTRGSVSSAAPGDELASVALRAKSTSRSAILSSAPGLPTVRLYRGICDEQAAECMMHLVENGYWILRSNPVVSFSVSEASPKGTVFKSGWGGVVLQIEIPAMDIVLYPKAIWPNSAGNLDPELEVVVSPEADYNVQAGSIRAFLPASRNPTGDINNKQQARAKLNRKVADWFTRRGESETDVRGRLDVPGIDDFLQICRGKA